jgi:anti-sigma-K factor RskA
VLRLSAPPATGTQFLVSLEPAGGSPTGQPTGPVLYEGTFSGPVGNESAGSAS